MDSSEPQSRRNESRRNDTNASATAPIRRLGEALVAVVVFGGMIYLAASTRNVLLQVVAVGAGGFGYMLLRRLWTIEDRITALEESKTERES